MNFLVPLASLLGIEVEAMTDRLKRTIIVNAVMAVFGLIGVSFLLLAGYLATSEVVGPVYAALIFGGVFVVLALAVYLGSRLGETRRKREIVEKRRSSETGALLTTAAITALPMLLKSPAVRTLGLPAAALAAFLVLRSKDKD